MKLKTLRLIEVLDVENIVAYYRLIEVLDAEKIMAYYLDSLVHFCDASVGAKYDLLVCMLACFGSLVESPTLFRSD